MSGPAKKNVAAAEDRANNEGLLRADNNGRAGGRGGPMSMGNPSGCYEAKANLQSQLES